MKTTSALAASLAMAIYSASIAHVTTVTFDWATVGDPGNAPDQLYTHHNPNNLQLGAVDYTYRISKHEVTNDQYVDFLNAVDAKGTNPAGVYNSYMTSNA